MGCVHTWPVCPSALPVQHSPSDGAAQAAGASCPIDWRLQVASGWLILGPLSLACSPPELCPHTVPLCVSVP